MNKKTERIYKKNKNKKKRLIFFFKDKVKKNKQDIFYQ